MAQQEQEEVRGFLRRLGEEFPSALGPEEPLPLRPLSRGPLSLEEVQGESLELGLRLLESWSTPAELSAILCQAAVAKVLQSDLSPFHCPLTAPPQGLDPEPDQDGVQLLQSEPLLRFFLNTLREVGVAWHRTPPTLSPSPASFVPQCFSHAIRNTRRKMEDRHVALAHFNQLLNLQDGVLRRYYAVFDGHGGADAASFAAAHLHATLSAQPALCSDTETAFRNAFLETDRLFRDKARRERLRSGSTAVAALLQDRRLTLAWLGDSQALLVSQGAVVPLMEPHKPEREDERQRVEGLGGCVTFMGCWRVNGTYAVSRAIGDFDQKPYVSADADCCSTQLSGVEDYLLLACDGFFDTVTPAQVPQLVLDALEGGEGVAPAGEGVAPAGEGVAPAGEGVAQKLVAHARDAGSSDNITVMVVFLRPPQSILAQGRVAAPLAPDTSSNSNTQNASEQ